MYKVGIIGATGMVGQRFITLLQNHDWFEITLLCASPSSVGKTYKEAVGKRWAMDEAIPETIANMKVYSAYDIETIKNSVDFVFCAVNMQKSDIVKLEETLAKNEIPVISNNSACRAFDDVPMIIPELNHSHCDIIPYQKKRLGTQKGFIAVKSNCSIQSYVPAIFPLLKYKPELISVCTYQAISGAGKTFDTWPEMVDNVIPYISGEDEKSEKEPEKIFGNISEGKIVNNNDMLISAQCIRVPVSNGHMAAVSIKFKNKPSIEQILNDWNNFSPAYTLPSSPAKFLNYFDSPDRPQTASERDLHKGMAISLGRLREDRIFDYKFIGLSHNTIRGAAGGAILLAELLVKKGYI